MWSYCFNLFFSLPSSLGDLIIFLNCFITFFSPRWIVVLKCFGNYPPVPLQSPHFFFFLTLSACLSLERRSFSSPFKCAKFLLLLNASKWPTSLIPLKGCCHPSIFILSLSSGPRYLKDKCLEPLSWLSGGESTCQCRRYGFDSWFGKIHVPQSN